MQPQPSAAAAASPVTTSGPATIPVAADALPDPGIELPAGSGREILLNRCLGCHDLGGLALFSSFYTRDDWRDLVLTMITHGAAVDAVETETLADYLALHFGAR